LSRPTGIPATGLQLFRHALAMVFVKHMPMRPLVHRPSQVCFSATAQSIFCIVFAKVWNCFCCKLLQHVSNTFALFTPRFHSLQRPILIETLQHVFNVIVPQHLCLKSPDVAEPWLTWVRILVFMSPLVVRAALERARLNGRPDRRQCAFAAGSLDLCNMYAMV
jgi:hypothetical protein